MPEVSGTGSSTEVIGQPKAPEATEGFRVVHSYSAFYRYKHRGHNDLSAWLRRCPEVANCNCACSASQQVSDTHLREAAEASPPRLGQELGLRTTCGPFRSSTLVLRDGQLSRLFSVRTSSHCRGQLDAPSPLKRLRFVDFLPQKQIGCKIGKKQILRNRKIHSLSAVRIWL